MSDSAETYCVVVYTDGKQFISPRGFGKISSVISLPKSKLKKESNDSEKMQAVLALFNQTGIRIELEDIQELGNFSSDENFNLQVYYMKVKELPPVENLKSNEYFTPVGSLEDVRISTIEKWDYIDFSSLEENSYIYSLKGIKNVLYQINQHFEKGVEWKEIA